MVCCNFESLSQQQGMETMSASEAQSVHAKVGWESKVHSDWHMEENLGTKRCPRYVANPKNNRRPSIVSGLGIATSAAVLSAEGEIPAADG